MAAGTNQHQYIKITQDDREFFLTALSAKDIVHISYVSRRGVQQEQGAVQRLLNPKRISSISDFARTVGDFPSSIILNWVNTTYPLKYTTRRITIPKRTHSAQIIDGQHRVAGLEQAISEDSSIGKLEVPVAIYDGLDTRACADIFLSINTEQKPVPKSLVYDLYGEASEFIVDRAAERARDLAIILNEHDESPYREFIKFPGPVSRGSHGIALSTVVTALKPLVEDKGTFEQVELPELHMQEQALLNFLWVLQDCYEDAWFENSNAFRYAAGFTGAIEFFRTRILSYCHLNRDFTQGAVENVFTLSRNQLITQAEIKGLQGRKAFNTVAELLDEGFKPSAGQFGKIKL